MSDRDFTYTVADSLTSHLSGTFKDDRIELKDNTRKETLALQAFTGTNTVTTTYLDREAALELATALTYWAEVVAKDD